VGGGLMKKEAAMEYGYRTIIACAINTMREGCLYHVKIQHVRKCRERTNRFVEDEMLLLNS